MPKVWKLAASTWLALFIIAGQAHAAERSLTPNERHDRVRYETLERPQWTYRETRLTIVGAADKWNDVSASMMLCIANRESNLDEDAYNSSSGASGLFQHLRSYWPSRVRAYNASVGGFMEVHSYASPFSARANALVSAWYMHRYGLSAWGGGC